MRTTALIFGLGLVACGMVREPRWKPRPDQLEPLPDLNADLKSTVGPLAIDARPSETSWARVLETRRIAEDHYLDASKIRAETDEYLRFIDAFFPPARREQPHRSAEIVNRLAPYSAYNVTLSYQQSSDGLHLCILNAGVMTTCDRTARSGTAIVPLPAPPEKAFEIRRPSARVAMLAVYDLRPGARGWTGFASQVKAISDRDALVIDLRDAIGSDPRPLWAFVLALTGRASLAPLRAIERPAEADRFVATYEQRFSDRGRDPALWQSFVGSPPADPSPTTRRPIAILVGPRCHSACELVARTLETYARATVFGGVADTGRLARDEPAMFVLPHSRTSVYFHATRYLLATAIERATGPTDAWHAASDGDSDRARDEAFAIREVTHRLAHPEGFAKCSALAPEPSKLHGTGQHCPNGSQVIIHATIPPAAMRRFLASCQPALDARSYSPNAYWLNSPNAAPDVLARIAASELIDRVEVDCVHQYHLD